MSERDDEYEAPSADDLARAMPGAFAHPEHADMIFTYNPEPDPPLPDPGVTSGYLVMREVGSPDARVAKAAMLVGDDGIVSVVLTSDFSDAQIVDDTEGES